MPHTSGRRQTCLSRNWPISPCVCLLLAFWPLTLVFGWGPVRGIRATEGVAALPYCLNPRALRRGPCFRRSLRPWAFAAGFAASMAATNLPALAQDDGMSILRDTETEEMLQSYEAPLAKAAGLDPSPRVWLLGDPEVNAFASYGDP